MLMAEEIQGDMQEVQLEINDNTTSYNHNISVRIVTGKTVTPEKLSKIAMDRAHEIRKMVKDGFKQ
jgi:hypothetical protein|tara:strand:+ start:153 stop:350 length:198 start_codon:yes stop_codon:yes gene_type:complete